MNICAMAHAAERFVYPPCVLEIQLAPRTTLGYEPMATRQVPTIKATLLVVASSKMKPATAMAKQISNGMALALNRSAAKVAIGSDTIAKAYGIMENN